MKELACIAENVLGPQDAAEYTADENDIEDGKDYSLFRDNDCVQKEYCGDVLEVTGELIRSNEATDENVVGNFEPILYQEEVGDFRSHEPLSLAEIAFRIVVQTYKNIPGEAKFYAEKVTRTERKRFDEPVLYEQFCDFVNTDRNSPLSCQEDKSLVEFEQVNRTLDKCLKVYTHKRRKSVEGPEKKFVKMIDNLLEPQIGANCIDLMEEPSKNDTELESNYIMSLSAENVATIIGFVRNEATDEAPINFNKEARRMKEILSNDNRIISSESSPALRRSMRLNHQENEDSRNNNNPMKEMDRRQESKKESLNRYRNKESDTCCESDENKAKTKSSDSPRSLRSNSTNSRLSLSKTVNRRDEKSRANGKRVTGDSCQSFVNKFNTIATVSRALWGDMSDCLDNSEKNIIEFSDHLQSKEIPFAVGLLPLRAALERMQAMPDYQPRKTRSSVTTPFRQEFKAVKRKSISGNFNLESSNSGVNQRQSNNSNGNNLQSNTVNCHVHITTSHSHPVKQRRRFITEQVEGTISTANIVNGQ